MLRQHAVSNNGHESLAYMYTEWVQYDCRVDQTCESTRSTRQTMRQVDQDRVFPANVNASNIFPTKAHPSHVIDE
jgi:hypothetical protein